MSVWEYSTRLNVVVRYVPRITTTNRDKIRILVNRLRSYIAKDVKIGDHALSSYSKALNRA